MTLTEIIAQFFSAAAYILFLFCYHGKSMKRVLTVKLCADIFGTTAYILLGAYSGMAMNIISAVRGIIYINNDKKFFKHRIWMFIFMGISLTSAVITWKSFYSILPALAGAISTYSLWQKNVKVARIIALLINILLFTYNLCVGSYAGMVGEALGFISVMSALLINEKKAKKKINSFYH